MIQSYCAKYIISKRFFIRDIAVRYCSKTKFGNTRRIAEEIAEGKEITVCEDYFYAHILNIDGKLETAKEFGKRMIEQ